MIGILCFLFVIYLTFGITQKAHLVIPKGHLEGITSVCFSPDGKFILSGSRDHTAKIWNLLGHEVETFNLDKDVLAVAFSPDEKFILTGSAEGKIKLWKISGELIQTIDAHVKDINSIAFSPDGYYMLSASDDFTAKL